MAQAVGGIGPTPARAPAGAKEMTAKGSGVMAFFLGRHAKVTHRARATMGSFAPPRLGENFCPIILPTAYAMGYVLSPAPRAQFIYDLLTQDTSRAGFFSFSKLAPPITVPPHLTSRCRTRRFPSPCYLTICKRSWRRCPCHPAPSTPLPGGRGKEGGFALYLLQDCHPCIGWR